MKANEGLEHHSVKDALQDILISSSLIISAPVANDFMVFVDISSRCAYTVSVNKIIGLL